ncbi:MFS transporter [Candidatus Falkowbacteria bacterium]|nr:MFS transporter [Candidatus Falkowbacteria bacterium]
MKKITKVTKIILANDLFIALGWGLIAPVMAIFIVGNINGGNAEVAGIATGVYWITKSILQVPIGRWLDKNHGEKDDFWCLVLGTLIGSIAPIGMFYATLPWHLYFWEFFTAITMAMVVPAWGGIFIRHIRKGQEGFWFGLDSAAIGIGAGVAGILGGIIAETFGFAYLFWGVAFLQIASGLLLFCIKHDLYPPSKVVELISKDDGRKK